MMSIDEQVVFMPTLMKMRRMKFVKAVRKKRREAWRARVAEDQIDRMLDRIVERIDLREDRRLGPEAARARRVELADIEMERLLHVYGGGEDAEAGPD